MLTTVTSPELEPISLSDAKDHLRVDITTDDALIEGYIAAAREYAENVTRRALITQTLEYVLDGWPSGVEIQLPRPPLQSVTSVKYVDDDDVEHTFAPSNYHAVTAGQPGRIVLGEDSSWPTDDLRPGGAITIRFVAGYGNDPEDVPRLIRQAMMMMIGLLYENREGGARLDTVDLLLWPQRAF